MNALAGRLMGTPSGKGLTCTHYGAIGGIEELDFMGEDF